MPGDRRGSRTIRAGGIELTLGEDPWSILRARNLSTRRLLSPGGTHAIILRLASRVSDPLFLTRVESVTDVDHGLRIDATDCAGTSRARLELTAAPEGIRCDLRVSAPEPVWMAEWKVTGLDISRVVVPALGGQALGARMPRGASLTYKYPFWWNAQFLIGETPGGGFWLRTMETAPRFKLVRVKRAARGFDITYGAEADAPLTRTTLEASWTIDCYRGHWGVPVEIHRAWMESAFGLQEIARNPRMPAWAREIDCVLEIWGIGKESPRPLHTFAQAGKRLRAWAKMHDPSRTLVYLPGFTEHGIDSHAPDYGPSPELGGEEGFRALVAAAHALGYRVMVHTNAIAMTFDHPRFPRFREHQVVDAFGRTQGWGLDIDGDWLPEPYFAYINPGVREWSDLMAGVIGGLIRSFGVDAVFLDQTLLAFNVSRGPNFVAGMREHILRLEREFPGVLFAGEGMHEQVAAALPLAQIHGIDSIADVHAMEGGAGWRTAHPVSTRLFGPYTRFVPHLLTRHPSHRMFALQEAAYAKLGVMPALCLYDNDQEMAIPAVRAMLRRAGRRRSHA